MWFSFWPPYGCGHFIHPSVRAEPQAPTVTIQAQTEKRPADWTASVSISLDSGMPKARKVIPIPQGKRRIPPSAHASVHEEFRLLTCRQTSDSFSFHLGPPLFVMQLPIRATPSQANSSRFPYCHDPDKK